MEDVGAKLLEESRAPQGSLCEAGRGSFQAALGAGLPAAPMSGPGPSSGRGRCW